MTRTGKAPRLLRHLFEPYAEVHPEDARHACVVDGGLARLSTPLGTTIVRVRVAGEQRRGCIFMPMHWTGEVSSHGRVNVLVNPAVDPVSGQPELKHTPVALAPHRPAWHGFALTRRKPANVAADYWVRGRTGAAWRTELAGEQPPDAFEDFARDFLCPDPAAAWLAYRDSALGVFRYASVRNGRLDGCLFVAADQNLPGREWLSGLFEADALSVDDRKALLLGEPLDPAQDIGAIVCSCFSVGRTQIESAIAEGAASVDAVGQRLRAGTNCGSCKPELSRILQAVRAVA